MVYLSAAFLGALILHNFWIKFRTRLGVSTMPVMGRPTVSPVEDCAHQDSPRHRLCLRLPRLPHGIHLKPSCLLQPFSVDFLCLFTPVHLILTEFKV